MGCEADAFLAYGVILGNNEGDKKKAPWLAHYDESDEYVESQDPEDWWRNINGYEPPFEPDWENYPKWRDTDKYDLNLYYSHRREWEKENPMPFEDLIYCSWDYDCHLLAIPGLLYRVLWGDYERIKPIKLLDSVETEKEKELLRFCQKYGILYEDGPGWFLVSRLDI